LKDASLAALHQELAAAAMDVARELVNDKPDMERVAELNARRAELREAIQQLRPRRRDEFYTSKSDRTLS
jgi:hypothetical protein